MITQLILQNFRRHTDVTIDFTSGINVIRAANEGGKSTSLEAINYALFGARVLRDSLEDTVTWGEDVKRLKVVASFLIEGKIYTFSRGKSGAEVTLDGAVFVTGQNEVTAFAAKLFAADAAVASKLMMASQNGIRGALEEGPKALSLLIEELSDMGVFDQILDAAQHKLTLGNPSLIEERLKGAEATLEAATQNLPAAPEPETHALCVADLNKKAAEVEGKIPDLTTAAAEAETKWFAVANASVEKDRLVAELARVTEQVEQWGKNVTDKSAAAGVVVSDSRPALKLAIEAERNHEARTIAHRIFRNLPDGERYQGDLNQYDKDCEYTAAKLKLATKTLSALDQAIMTTSGRRINHDKCDKCGQDVTHLAHVIETNTNVDAELARLNGEKVTAQVEVDTLTKAQDGLSAYRRFANRIQPDLAKLHGFVEVLNNSYPAVLVWIGDIPVAGDRPSVADLQRQHDEIERQIKAVEAAAAQHKMAQEHFDAVRAQQVTAQAAVDAFKGPTPEEVSAAITAHETAVAQRDAAKAEVQVIKSEVERVEQEFKTTSALWASSQARVNDAKAVIASCKDDLSSIAFNNGLVKKLRTLRPMIADKLWNTVLSGVSAMFSQMRGVPSIVSKGKDGFRCNDKPVESLSGSTLDVLGIAMRSALLRTFVPQCSMLVLDEPAQGCDEARTETMLGFLQALGMTQTLLVTHEQISESVADNIIHL